ncbi:aec79 [Escherichia coli]|nr:aec79 [Escherichia coli]
MSDITISRPEVVTGHTDVICSTSIQHVVTVRNAALQQTETLIQQLAEISVLTAGIGGKNRPGLGDETEFSLWLLADGKTGSSNESHHPQSRSRNLA